MKKKRHILILLVMSIFCYNNLTAQDFVYTPKNPAFGGDTFNYNWLLSSAQAQNLLEDPETNSEQSALETFRSTLERQLLSNISRELSGAQFGESTLEDGLYQIGDFSLDVLSTIDGLTITITDGSIGEQTQIIIPYF